MCFKGKAWQKYSKKQQEMPLPRRSARLELCPLSCAKNAAGGGESSVSATGRVFLIPFRTLTLHPFSFPFGKRGSVRSALMLSLRPVLGNMDGSVSLVVQITEQTPDLTRGIAWLAARSEVEEWEARLGSGAAFWPAPLAFAAEVSGNGIAVWSDRDGSSAIWFNGGSPLFYRWMSSADGSPEELADWMTAYAKAAGQTAGMVRIFKDGDASPDYIRSCGESALLSIEGLDTLDLSSRGAEAAEKTEAFFDVAFKTAKVFAAAGFAFLVLSAAVLAQNMFYKDAFDAAPALIYEKVFKERSPFPLRSVNGKLKAVTQGGDGVSFERTVGALSSSWKAPAVSSGAKIDSLRYGPERTEIEGIANSMDSIQSLRDSLAGTWASVKIGEVQQTPGNGIRFSIIMAGQNDGRP